MAYDIPSISDLEAIQLLNKHYAEVITSKAGGVASAADITQTTNPITGVVRRTLYKILDDMDDTFLERLLKMVFTPAGTFTAGATLTDARQTLLWEVSQGGDGHYYSWSGTFPKAVTAGSAPSPIASGAWVDRTDVTLRSELNIVVKVFESVSDMKADTSLVVGQKCRTIGYYAVGDGGGNDYEIVAAATGTDDGGSYIDLPGSGLQAKGLFGLTINIKQFGAKGDGVTNDTAAAYSELAYHRRVIVPENCTIMINGDIKLLSRDAMVGATKATSKIIFDTGRLELSGNATEISNISLAFLNGSEFKMYNYSSNTASYLHSLNDVNISQTNYSGGVGIHIKGYLNYFSNVAIDNCETAILFDSETNRNTFVGCSIKTYHTGTTNDGRALIRSTSGAGKNNVFIGCDLEGNPNKYFNVLGGHFELQSCYTEGHRDASSNRQSSGSIIDVTGGFYGGLVELPPSGATLSFRGVKFGESVLSTSYPLIQNFNSYSSFGTFLFEDPIGIKFLRVNRTIGSNYNKIYSSNSAHASISTFERIRVKTKSYILEAKDIINVTDTGLDIDGKIASLGGKTEFYSTLLEPRTGSDSIDLGSFRQAANFTAEIRFLSNDAGAAGVIEIDAAVTYALLSQNKRVVVASSQDANLSVVSNRLILTVTNTSASNIIAQCSIRGAFF